MTESPVPRTAILFPITFLLANFAMADGAVLVPIRLLQHFPVLSAKIGGVSVLLQFDSGNSGSVSLTQAVIDKVKAVPTGEYSQGIDGKGNVMKYPKYKLPVVKIGTLTFENVIGELDVHDPSYQATQVGQQGFLGTALLKNHRVVLDYSRRRITVLPGESAEPGGCVGVGSFFEGDAGRACNQSRYRSRQSECGVGYRGAHIDHQQIISGGEWIAAISGESDLKTSDA